MYVGYRVLSAVCLLAVFSCQKTTTPPFPPAPTVDAGPSQIIQLPVDSVKLSGSAHDSASRITGYIWSEISGPNTPVIADDGSPVTMVKGMVPGLYVFQLMAVDSLGQTGVDTVSVTVKGGVTVTAKLMTYFPGTSFSPYEAMWVGNSNSPAVNTQTPELLAAAWTINGIYVQGRSLFKFNMSTIPASAKIQSATLYLFSDTLPRNGDLVHANYGGTNDFWIQRVAASWDQTITFDTQPAMDTVGEAHIPQTSQPFLNLQVDVKTMVSNMLVNGNYGFGMRLNTEQIYNSRIFCATDYSDTTRRPYMMVTYSY